MASYDNMIASPNNYYFILFKGNLFSFDGKSVEKVVDFIQKYSDDLGDLPYDLEIEFPSYKLLSKNSSLGMEKLLNRICHAVPYVVCGHVNGNTIDLFDSPIYDVEHSNELKKLMKHFKGYTFKINGKEIGEYSEEASVLYHGTSALNVYYILSSGLRPKPERTMFRIKHTATVFITASYTNAEWYAKRAARQSELVDDFPCILFIDPNKINKDKIVFDYDVYRGHVAQHDDETYNSDIFNSNLQNTRGTNTFLVDKSKNPMKFNNVGYRGIVMPNSVECVLVVNSGEKLSPKTFMEKYGDEIRYKLEYMEMNENVESDEYVIGGEIEAPAGGRYYHVKPKKIKISENSAKRLFYLNENIDVFDTAKIGDIERYFDEGIKFKGNVQESNGRKDVILEYLDKNYNMPLYQYFKWASTADTSDLCSDIIYECPYIISEYSEKFSYKFPELEKFIGLEYEDYESFHDEFIQVLKDNKLCDHFKALAEDFVEYTDLPSWYYMSFKRVVKNEWCIHFGKDAYSIAREGFTGGTDDYTRLAFTGAGQQKRHKGYDFAYSLVTLDRNIDIVDSHFGHKYGGEAVIFRTSGVEVYHYADEEEQVIFYGPYAKDFVPIKYDAYEGSWVVYGDNDKVLKSGSPSEIAEWAELNLPQYKKKIMFGKNGIQQKYYDFNTKKSKYLKANNYGDYPFNEERMIRFIKELKHHILDEEFVADGNAEHNPYAKRWKQEREALKSFILNNGRMMQSRENGKTYMVYRNIELSNLIGYNYCICLQYDPYSMEEGTTVYIRAYDKFTERIFRPSFDTRGKDNLSGTYDDKI